MKVETTKDLNRIFAEEGRLIDEALNQGAREAIRRHQRAGLPIAIYRDGSTVWVQPKDVAIEGWKS